MTGFKHRYSGPSRARLLNKNGPFMPLNALGLPGVPAGAFTPCFGANVAVILATLTSGDSHRAMCTGLVVVSSTV